MELTDKFFESLKDVEVKIYEITKSNPFKYSVWAYPPGKYKLFQHHSIFPQCCLKYHDNLFSVMKDVEGNYNFQRGRFDWNIEATKIKTVEDFKKEINLYIAIMEDHKQMLSSKQTYLRQYL